MNVTAAYRTGMSNEDETIFLPLSIVISAILITSFLSTTSQFEQKALVESSNSNPLSKVPTIGNATSCRNSKNAHSDNQSSSSNPLSNVPVIGWFLSK